MPHPKLEPLRAAIAPLKSVLVAYSGGADSALLLRVAHDVLGERAMGAIAVSPTLPDEELQAALRVGREIGVAVHQAHTREMERAAFRRNDSDRCYHCKDELFTCLEPLAQELGLEYIAFGANMDDRGEHRPGARAASEHNVVAPLQDAGLGKDDVRAISKELGLSTWDKPALACLSSRIPYGMSIELGMLQQVYQAERAVRALGVAQVRVRHHGDVARIEVPADSFEVVMQSPNRERLVTAVKSAGYRYVTLDLTGYRSGSMNEGLKS